jgi:transposase InsO family protein
VTEDEMRKVVTSCRECQSIDPPPVQWDKGHLNVNDIWKRLACDVTHMREKKYLSLVDCGPSRFAIWKVLSSESSQAIVKVLEAVFQERGPPEEILLDNGASFRSKEIEDLCRKWGVKRMFRCAYKPSGNGIVERNHRTIKRMVARTEKVWRKWFTGTTLPLKICMRQHHHRQRYFVMSGDANIKKLRKRVMIAAPHPSMTKGKASM